MLFLAMFATCSVFLIYYSFFLAIIFAALCIVLMFIINYKKQSGVFIFCGVWLLSVMLSAAHSMNDIDRVSRLNLMTVSGEFVLVSASENRGDSYLCEIEVIECEHLEKGDKLQATYTGPQLEIGQSFRAKADVSDISNSTLAKSFYSKNIYAFADLSDIVLTNNDDFILITVNSVRKYIKNTIFEYFGEDEAATMLALLTGDRTFLNDTFYANINGAGVMHVLVVSGMHLSVIVAFALYLVNKLLYNRYLKALAIFLTILAVTAVCGFTMSILRAGITYLFVAVALLINRNSKSENSLGAAVSVILLFNPFAVFSVALQLSVLSTFGILCVAIPIMEFISQNQIIKSKTIQSMVASVLVTLSALLLTLPVTISVFGYVSNMSLITNLLIAFAVSWALCLCILGFILFPIRFILFYLAGLVIKYINFVINYFGSSEFAITFLPQWTAYLSAAVIFSVLFILVTCTKHDNMLKLKEIINKKIMEGGGKLKWPSFTKKR